MSFFSFQIIITFIFINYIVLCRGLTEAEDGSVCFDNCNGHGTCIDYSCHCYIGYHGDDCKYTFVQDENEIIPILSAGHFNVTKQNITKFIKDNEISIIGFSSYNCYKCIQVEAEYQKLSQELSKINIPFGRANLDEMKQIAADYEVAELPALLFSKKKETYLYKGVHMSSSILTYVKKLRDKPYTLLSSTKDVLNFLNISHTYNNISLATVSIVGFFSNPEGVEEDEFEEFSDTAKQLQIKEDNYFGLVKDKNVISYFKKQKLIDRSPSVILCSESGNLHSLNLDEVFDEKIGLKDWIERKSIPLIDELTYRNYRLYEKTGLPMLLLFLNLTSEDRKLPDPNFVGGKSGGIQNYLLISEFKEVAKEYSDKVNFVYVDGIANQDKMKSLGLYGGESRLPSLAFNTRENRKVPFPEELPINFDTINQYCAEFLSGKLKSPKDSLEFIQKALRTTVPLNSKNVAHRKDRKSAPEKVQGVSEQFGDGGIGDNAIIEVDEENFEEIVMDEEKDVVLVFYATDCVSCSHFAVYYKRMALRFHELNIQSIVIARMDLTNASPPSHLNIINGNLPLMLIIPAQVKHEPWAYYSGHSKVQPMMKWIQNEASIPFDLPNLPHLSDEQVTQYKQQIREREESLEKERREDEELRQRLEAKRQLKLKHEKMKEIEDYDNTEL